MDPHSLSRSQLGIGIMTELGRIKSELSSTTVKTEVDNSAMDTIPYDGHDSIPVQGSLMNHRNSRDPARIL